jgi:predicted small metal-binding protein
MAKELKFRCPVCGQTVITSESESELIRMVKDHAKREHKMDLSDEQIRKMMKEQAEAEVNA